MVDEISDLQAEANVLKITVHDKLADDPRDSIFVMATNSEILQIDQEISSLRNHLTEIDSIYRNNLHPLKLVEVKPVAEFGQIRELSDVLAQLKSLQKDADLNAFTQEEVKKKIHETSQNLEKEVINAIDQLKTKVGSLLNQKQILQQSAVDAIEESRLSISRDPAVAKLEDIRTQLARLKSEFEQKQLEWMAAKKAFSLIPKTN